MDCTYIILTILNNILQQYSVLNWNITINIVNFQRQFYSDEF